MAYPVTDIVRHRGLVNPGPRCRRWWPISKSLGWIPSEKVHLRPFYLHLKFGSARFGSGGLIQWDPIISAISSLLKNRIPKTPQHRITFLVTTQSTRDRITSFRVPLKDTRPSYRWGISASQTSAFTVAPRCNCERHIHRFSSFFSIQHAKRVFFSMHSDSFFLFFVSTSMKP